jgi:hypothetical protein
MNRGAAAAARRRAPSLHDPSTLDEPDQYDDDRDHQENVDESAHRV